MAMLVMTFGMTEIVKLAHPRDWVTFLYPELHQPRAERHIASLMEHAAYEKRTGLVDKPYYLGEVSGIDAVTSFGDTMKECREELRAAVRDWVLLRLARGERIIKS